VLYFALKRKHFYATLRCWETSQSHPLFIASDNRHRTAFIVAATRLVKLVVLASALTIFVWAIHPFVSSVANLGTTPAVTTAASTASTAASAPTASPNLQTFMVEANLSLANGTDFDSELDIVTSLPLTSTTARAVNEKPAASKLLINAWYPWNPYGSTFAFFMTYVYQVRLRENMDVSYF